MLIEEKFIPLVKKFCQLKNIPISNGRVSPQFQGMIQEYIKKRLAKENQITKELENMSIKTPTVNVLNRIKGMVLDSPIEEYMWHALEREKLVEGAHMQYKMGKYRIDIAFPKNRLAIECDGREYHRANQLQLERDQKRDKYLARKGWVTLRFTGLEIRRDIQFCIKKIKMMLKNRGN